MKTIIDTMWIRDGQFDEVREQMGANRPHRSVLTKAAPGLYLEATSDAPEMIRTVCGTYRMSRYHLIELT
jgi:hypothetical protein